MAKLCQGPQCHEYKTKDRIRGSKGDKHYETRKRAHLAYGNEWCSMQCYNDWLNRFGTRAIDYFGRLHEPKRQDANGAWYKTTKYQGYESNPRYLHYFVNDLLGERRLITEQQYDDTNLVRP